MKKAIATSQKFYSYQKERFPIAILGLSLLPAALSSAVIVSTHPTGIQVVLAVVASLAYLLHIRVIDEHRDYGHDNIHHTTRPIQAGVISREELWYVDFVAVAILIITAAIAGWSALITVAIMLTYSYLAGKEFFVGEKIRRSFFVYNGANLLQMLLMQIFVYSVFANPIPLNLLVLTHFLFTTIGTVVFEFVRKLKIPGDDGTGKDTYTWYLGFNNSMAIYLLLVLLNAALFFKISTMLSSHLVGLLIFSVCAASLTSFTVLIHWLKKQRQTDQLMQLSFLLMYGAFNLAIYFLTN